MSNRPIRKSKFSTEGEITTLKDSPESLFRQARITAFTVMPICSPAIRALIPTFTDREELAPGVPMTMAVDQYYRLLVGNKFILYLKEIAEAVSDTNPCGSCGETSHQKLAYIGGVICHEAWHMVRRHNARMKAQDFLDWNKWGLAADLELNDDLMTIFKAVNRPKLCLPPTGVFPEKYRETPNNAIRWQNNPKAEELEKILKQFSGKELEEKLSSFFDSFSEMDNVELSAFKQVEEYGTEIWKQFRDNRLAEEYYMILPENKCPVHGDKKKLVLKGKGTSSESQEKSESQDKEGNNNTGNQKDGEGSSFPEVSPHCTCPHTTEHGTGVGNPKEDSPPSPDSPGISQAEAKIIAKEVAKKVQASKSRGNVPAGMERWADQELEGPRYDWKSELSKSIRYGAGRKHGDECRTFRRLGILTGVYRGRILFPTKYDPVPNISVIIDTSGSMDEKALKDGVQETQGIIEAAGSKVRYTSVDAAATDLKDIENINDISLTGGGGTDMRVGINKALEDTGEHRPSVIIVMTDGYTPWPTEPINHGETTLIVCLCGEGTADLESVPSWALGIKIDDNPVVKEAV